MSRSTAHLPNLTHQPQPPPPPPPPAMASDHAAPPATPSLPPPPAADAEIDLRNPPSQSDSEGAENDPGIGGGEAVARTGQPFFEMPAGMSLGPFASSVPPVAVRPSKQQQQQQQQQQEEEAMDGAAKPVEGARRRASYPARIKRKRGPGGLIRLHSVSPELQTIVGEPIMPRTQIIKQFWAYIRKNNLQDPNNRRKIICNDGLRLVLETDCTDIFEMNKLLAKHITPLEPNNKDAVKDNKKSKTEDVAKPEPDATPRHMTASAELVEFLGTGETEFLQSKASNRIWDYIKDNQLEDPVQSMILCDSKLQQLFGCERLAASGVSEMLSRHLVKKS